MQRVSSAATRRRRSQAPAAERRPGLGDQTRRDVGADIRCDASCRGAEQVGHDRHVHALLEQDRRRRVAQGVEGGPRADAREFLVGVTVGDRQEPLRALLRSQRVPASVDSIQSWSVSHHAAASRSAVCALRHALGSSASVTVTGTARSLPPLPYTWRFPEVIEDPASSTIDPVARAGPWPKGPS